MARQRSRGLPEAVFRRGPVYVFRRQVPPELRAKLGKREVFKSLATGDELEARILGVIELVLSERRFTEAKESLLLDTAAESLHHHHTDSLAALARLLQAEPDATRRATLGLLLTRLTFPRPTHSRAGQTMSELLSYYLEAEQPPATERAAVTTAVERFIDAMGDMRAADVGMTALRRFEALLPPADRAALVKATQGLLLWFREVPPEDLHHGAGMTLTALLDAWHEAEKPSLPEFHAVAVNVDRFVKAMGDRRVADVTATVLEGFEQVLAVTPHQRGGQPLHRSGREAAVGAVERLLRWRAEGGPERAAHVRSLETKKEGGGP
jgi:hypothetical protein